MTAGVIWIECSLLDCIFLPSWGTCDKLSVTECPGKICLFAHWARFELLKPKVPGATCQPGRGRQSKISKNYYEGRSP